MKISGLLVLALISPASAQSLDETMLLLISPGYYEQILQDGKPYTLKQPALPPYRGSLNIEITIPGKCTADIQYDEIDGKEMTRMRMKLDFARATGLDSSGSSRPGVIIRGIEGFLCRKYSYGAEDCSGEFWPLNFTADLFSKQDSWQYRNDVRIKYEKAFAYYQSTFCKKRGL